MPPLNVIVFYAFYMGAAAVLFGAIRLIFPGKRHEDVAVREETTNADPSVDFIPDDRAAKPLKVPASSDEEILKLKTVIDKVLRQRSAIRKSEKAGTATDAHRLKAQKLNDILRRARAKLRALESQNQFERPDHLAK